MFYNKILTPEGKNPYYTEQKPNFPCYSDNQTTYVSTIRQKCFVNIDEEGTEAAAATLAKLAQKCSTLRIKKNPVDFHVQSPFTFIIYQPVSGILLFSGVVSNPIEA